MHEVVRLMGDEELFTFVTHVEVDATNNEAEPSLRGSAMNWKTGRTSKKGSRCQTANGSGQRFRITQSASSGIHLGERTGGSQSLARVWPDFVFPTQSKSRPRRANRIPPQHPRPRHLTIADTMNPSHPLKWTATSTVLGRNVNGFSTAGSRANLG